MKANEIRQAFIDFFKAKDHHFVPSAPLINKDDPTLMFTNAGMNQFKDFFLGTKAPQYKRVANSQKCLRVSGKHNDLEEVGLDTYHHTFFEMLGNWSFGDYFKADAIAWGWELITEVFKLPANQLYVTVFGGDEAEGLDADHEAEQLWEKWIDKNRILYGSKKENFWEMGETGPCGPSSEIHIDLRPESERKEISGDKLVNQDHPQVVELWNLVFIQYNRLKNGSLESLPARHVDTGMGLERLAMAMQGVSSNYDTDVFKPLIQALEKRSGLRYGKEQKTDIALRVSSDHVRAVAFSIADGQLPSNTGAGYVIRRILRRAVRYGFTYLNQSSPFLCDLVEVLVAQMGQAYPELKSQQEFIEKVMREEEASFLRTLEQGLKRLEAVAERGISEIPGAVAFELYDTYGFPLDLTRLIAREKGLQVDESGFTREMQAQKERSKADAVRDTGDWTVLVPDVTTDFVGYDHLEARARIVRYREVEEKKKRLFHIVLDQTPFYAESGGQVGDRGVLIQHKERVPVLDTIKENELTVHITPSLPNEVNEEVEAVVDQEKRERTMANHSATHLLHAALRKVLGDHVQQKGSYVDDQILRFDFSHFSKMTDQELRKVESMVNDQIRRNVKRQEERQVPIAQARKRGAMALFGEKYGETVRVITFDPDYSVELCGGTHVLATGNIGYFKIISEGSISAGVRRIEAITGKKAEEWMDQQLDQLDQIRQLLKAPKEIPDAVEKLLQEKNRLAKQMEQMQLARAADEKDRLISDASKYGATYFIAAKINLPSADALKKLAFDLKNQLESVFALLAADIQGKPMIAVMMTDDVVNSYELHAGNLVKDYAQLIKGGGGGQPFYATAGGKDVEGLDAVVAKANRLKDEKFAEKSI